MGLTPERLRSLAQWLLVPDPHPRWAPPARDIFREKTSDASTWLSKPAESRPEATTPPVELPSSEPRLTGFVIRQDKDGQSILAVIRAAGETWLVGAGERAGPYLVEEMVALEEVHLIDETSGLRFILRLE